MFALMNKADISRGRRQYSSALRDEQAEQTRDRILAALGELLAGGELDELSFPAIAKHAGVSVPTVYRYFPNRKALFEGIEQWLSRELKAPPFPTEWTALAAGSPELFAYYDKGKELFRAAHVSSLFSDVQRTTRLKRDRRLAALLEPLTDHLERRDANAIHALVRLLYSFEGFQFMSTRFGLTPDETSNVVAWAMRAIATQIEAGKLMSSRSTNGKSQKARASKSSRSTKH